MNTFQTAAKAFSDSFKTFTRHDGSRYVSLVEDAPGWMREAVYEVHQDRGPNDWVYEHCSYLVERIAECDRALDVDSCEIADALVDVYTTNLTAWLASHPDNVALCDEAVSEGLIEADAPMARRIAVAQYMFLDRACAILTSAIETADPGEDINESEAETCDGDPDLCPCGKDHA